MITVRTKADNFMLNRKKKSCDSAVNFDIYIQNIVLKKIIESYVVKRCLNDIIS